MGNDVGHSLLRNVKRLMRLSTPLIDEACEMARKGKVQFNLYIQREILQY